MASDYSYYLGKIVTGDFTYHGRLTVNTTWKSVVNRKIAPATESKQVMNFRFKTTKTVRTQDISLLLCGTVYRDNTANPKTLMKTTTGSTGEWHSDGVSDGLVWLPGGWNYLVATQAKLNDVIIDRNEGQEARFEKYLKFRLGRYNPSLKSDEGYLAGVGFFEDDINRRGDYYDKTNTASKARIKNTGAVLAMLSRFFTFLWFHMHQQTAWVVGIYFLNRWECLLDVRNNERIRREVVLIRITRQLNSKHLFNTPSKTVKQFPCSIEVSDIVFLQHLHFVPC